MFFNPLLFAAVALGALLFLAGFRLAESHVRLKRGVAWALAVLLSLPALACTAYYLHLIQDTPTYIALRSIPGVEVLCGGIGLLAGMLTRVLRLPRRWKWVPGLIGFGLLLAPFLKPILLPVTMQGTFQDRWSDGVCLQSGHSTCGPASLATLMALYGDRRTEKETARKSYSSLTGTEIWYLVRLARNRGFLVSWGDAASLKKVPVPAMIGTTMTGSGAGHFITLLGRTPSHLEVGDPLIGRRTFTAEQFAKRYRFSGRWLTIKREMDVKRARNDILRFVHSRYPKMEVRLEPWREDPAKTAVFFVDPQFTPLYPMQRFHYLSQLIPQEYKDRELAGTVWFELAPGESPEALRYPDDELIARITGDVMKLIDEARVFEALDDAFCPAAARAPRTLCYGDFRNTKAILSARGFNQDDFFDLFHVIMAQGGYCDCEILYNVAKGSRLAAEHWKARAEGRESYNPHMLNQER